MFSYFVLEQDITTGVLNLTKLVGSLLATQRLVQLLQQQKSEKISQIRTAVQKRNPTEKWLIAFNAA